MKKKNITYLRATPRDTDIVVSMRIAFHEDVLGKQRAAEVRRLRREMTMVVRRMLGNREYVCWLAFSGVECVGAGGIVFRQRPGYFGNPSGREGYVMSVYTRADMRKKGIAATIVKKLLAESKKRGIRFVDLHASPGAEGLYRRLGFELHPEPPYKIKL